MSNDDEKVNWLGIIDSLLEPGLLNKVSSLSDFGDVRVSSEVEDDSKSHDAEAILGSEISVLGTDVLIQTSARVYDLDIACEVSITIVPREVGKSLVRNIGHIQLVVADCKKIVFDVLENRV